MDGRISEVNCKHLQGTLEPSKECTDIMGEKKLYECFRLHYIYTGCLAHLVLVLCHNIVLTEFYSRFLDGPHMALISGITASRCCGKTLSLN